ncbi:protein FAM53A [Cervus elaphus]|uniref:protein FAM53A n=1 Tax=Cervus elaphus TaxID=9860 RepID=UPI001CC2E2AD|nr:protein FAM53A [Cervus elaphus]
MPTHCVPCGLSGLAAGAGTPAPAWVLRPECGCSGPSVGAQAECGCSGPSHPREVVGGGRPDGSQVAVGPASPFLPGPRGPSVGTLRARDLRGSARSPSVLPTKWHGRSLSEPDERASGGSPRHPSGPRVWTPVTKRRCHSGGSAWLPGRALPVTRAASPLAPWPASASGSLPAPGLGRPPAGARTPSPRCRLSLAQERLVPAGAAPPSAGSAPTTTPASTPEPVPPLLAAVRTRGREGPEETRARGGCPRPALNFLKMARTLKTSKSLCPLGYEDEDEEDT